ncbi:MAG: hypothetical protein LBS53_06275 [Synergistaceae bacterium]|jgi:hypothetical protein|nr:hypothetical protein [Synergistaceae bacterium]
MRKIRLLPGMKFMSGSVLYRPGDILPDTADTLDLVRQKKAEYVGGADEGNSPALSAETESYEIKNVRTLEYLAKERDIDIPRGTNKAGIIALLKAWDIEHAGGDGNEGAD